MCGKDQQGAADVSPPMRAARATLLTPNGTHPIRRTSSSVAPPPCSPRYGNIAVQMLCLWARSRIRTRVGAGPPHINLS